MSLADRIKQRMDALKLSQAKVARSVGVSAPTVHDWVVGDIKELKSNNMQALARVLQCRDRWLSDGTGPISEDPSDHHVMQAPAPYRLLSLSAAINLTPTEREILDIISSLNEEAKRDVLIWLRGYSTGRKRGNGE